MATAIDPNITASAQELLDFLAALGDRTSNNKLMWGQWAGWKNQDYDRVEDCFNITGKYPAIVGRAAYRTGGTAAPVGQRLDNPYFIDYANAGGIICLSQMLKNPWTGGGGQYNGTPTAGQVPEILQPGTTAYNNTIIEWNNVADEVVDFDNAGIPVILRPYHEMNMGWNWVYQLGISTYRTLVQNMISHFHNTRNLHNILWEYGPTAKRDGSNSPENWYPGDAYVDLIAPSFYSDEIDDPTHAPSLRFGNTFYPWAITTGKPLGFSEMGNGLNEPFTMVDGMVGRVNELQAKYPKMVYALCWNDHWHYLTWPGGNVQTPQSGTQFVPSNNVTGVFAHPYVMTRDEVDLGETPVAPSTPAGATLVTIDNAISYGEEFSGGADATSDWDNLTDPANISSPSRQTEGEDQAGGTGVISYGQFTFVDTGADTGTIRVWVYAVNRTTRSGAVPWSLLDTVGEISSGTHPQNSGSNNFSYLGEFSVANAGELYLRVSNEGIDQKCGTDAVAYTFTATPTGGTITVDEAAGGTSSASGSTDSVSVALPANAAADDFLLVTLQTAQNRAFTVPTGFTAICSQTTTTLANNSYQAYYRILDGSTDPDPITTTLPSSANWTIATRRITNVDTAAPIAFAETTHSETDGGTYHDLLTPASGAVTVPAVGTVNSGDAAIQISSFRDGVADPPPSAVSSSKDGTATALFSNITDRPYYYGTLEIVDTPSTYTSGTHTYTDGATSGVTEACSVLTFVLKQEPDSSPSLTFPGTWATPPPAVFKNTQTSSIHDPINDAPVSGGSGDSDNWTVTAFALSDCSVSVANNLVTFAPAVGFDGVAQYSCTVADSVTEEEVTRTVSVTVTNRAPVATNQSVTVAAVDGTTKSIAGWATDADNDPITYTLVADTSTSPDGNVDASISGNVLTVNASSASDGTYTGITYKATDDSSEDSGTQTITVVVTDPPLVPTSEDFSVTIVYIRNSSTDPTDPTATAIDFLTEGNCTDPGGLALFLKTINGEDATEGGGSVSTTFGSVYNSGELMYYTPDILSSGIDTFTYIITNTFSDSVSATVTINREVIIQRDDDLAYVVITSDDIRVMVVDEDDRTEIVT